MSDADKVREMLKELEVAGRSISYSSNECVVYALVALIEEARGGEKEWCRHISWDNNYGDWFYKATNNDSWECKTGIWKSCPECGAKRPV